jgi:hypothetical protein
MSILTFNQHYNPANNPKLVVLNNIQLPWDTVIQLDDEKEITMSKILDGVVVFERILRNATEINFECSAAELNNMLSPTFMNKLLNGSKISLADQKNTDKNKFIALSSQLTEPPFLQFPQTQLKYMYQNIFSVNQVVPVYNTMLNDFGINEVVIKKISMIPARGSKVVAVRFQSYENYVGTNSLGTSLFVTT